MSADSKFDYPHGLCWRCEHRARFHEQGISLRFQCGAGGSVVSCYAHQPVRPLIVKKEKGDKRPLNTGLFSARMNPMAVADEIELHGKAVKMGRHKGIMIYWSPKKEKEK